MAEDADKTCVLVVDDDENLLELITQVLDLYGFEAHTAPDGSDALNMVKLKYYPLIISDIRMPVMTGTELLKEVRKYQADHNSKSKVILMTAYSSEEIQSNAGRLGADAFIPKPFDIQEFIKQVNQVLLST